MFQLELLLLFLPWLILLAIWLVIIALDAVIHLNKYGIEVGPFMLMARTQRFNKVLDRIGKWHPRAWRYIWSGFVGLAFFFSIYGFYLFGVNLFQFFLSITGDPGAQPGPIVPIVPGVTISLPLFVIILVPITISVIIHEVAHGIAARADDIPVKSSGLFALAFLFGAFVEPDEDYVKTKATRRARVRMYAAGSGANITSAFVVLFMLTFLVLPPQGVLVLGTVPGGAAEGVLTPGSVITKMNDTAIMTNLDLENFMASALPGDLVIFTVNGQIVNLILGTNPNNASRAFIGITLTNYQPLGPPFNLLGPFWGIEFQRSMIWFFIIALSLGIFNLLPVPPLDGDRLFKELIDVTISLERTSGRALLWGLRISALAIVILNIVFTLLNPELLAFLLR